MTTEKFQFVIIGGGIAGTTCAQRLCSIVDSDVKVLLLSATPLIKAVTNIKPMTKFLSTFDVEEKEPDTLTSQFGNLTVVQHYVSELDYDNHKITCHDGTVFFYDKLCICTGGKPKLIHKSEYVIGIRDLETVEAFQKKLKNARQIVLVGNGGIATELVYEIENCRIIWAVKHEHISHAYFDSFAAKFFEKRLNEEKPKEESDYPSKRTKYSITKLKMNENMKKSDVYGSALGPDWSLNIPIKGAASKKRDVSVEYKCEVKRIVTKEEYMSSNRESQDEWPIYVELTNGKIYGCDFVVSATGVEPSVELFTKDQKTMKVGHDGGLEVNEKLETSVKDVYAAGDVCTAVWQTSPHWFQMRLWSQARQMGDYAARSMWAAYQNKEIQLDFAFELFAHVTNFFNFKVILLGNYDAKGLGNDYELLIRHTEGQEYIKVVVHEGKIQGALLIGETDLEETMENLILNQLDVSAYGEDLLNPDIDIEDYFD